MSTTEPRDDPEYLEPEEGAESVDALTADMGGRWLVITVGSRHVWDLQTLTYQRLPGASRSRFDFDGLVLPIARVGLFPVVGAQSVVYFDDPRDWTVQQFRVSSTVESISRLPDPPDAGAE